MKRFKTSYPGVFYREVERVGGRGKERVYYILFKKNGKLFEEKVGKQFIDNMTEAKAARVRSDRIEGRRESRKEQREAVRALDGRWTISKLWESYKENKTGLKSVNKDEARFKKHIARTFGDKEPVDIAPLDLDRVRVNLSKTRRPATVKNVLELLRRIINYAEKKQLCKTPHFKITMPPVHNVKTEDLNQEQMQNLLRVLQAGTWIDKDGAEKLLDRGACDAMLLVLCSGMRAGEVFGLTWADVDFQRGFILLRDPKGGPDQTIPLSDAAHELLENRAHREDSPYIFPGSGGGRRVSGAKQFRVIRDAAGLPKDFRPMHGLRHTFASSLASSGEVDLYTIQRLLTHKSPGMTQRYAHLRDETLRSASNLAGNLTRKGIENQKHEEDIAQRVS